jgi:hypothetical protein
MTGIQRLNVDIWGDGDYREVRSGLGSDIASESQSFRFGIGSDAISYPFHDFDPVSGEAIGA